MRKSYIFTFTTGMAVAVATMFSTAAGQQVELSPGRATGHTVTRAVSVVEFTGAEPTSGTFRVVPITVYTNGNYVDGEIYLADPTPLALREGTIYELEESGKPVGYITIQRTAHMHPPDPKDPDADPDEAADFYGIGVLQKAAPDVEVASATPAKIVLPEEHRFEDVHAKEPKKRRRDRGNTTSGGTTAGGDTTSTSGKDAGKTSSKADKKRQPPIQIATMPPPSVEDDPDRPKLSRSARQKELSVMPESVPLEGNVRAMAAVSDPDNKEVRPFRYDFSGAEEKKYRDRMLELAYQQAVAAAKQRGRSVPPITQWTDVNLRAFNLALDNAATLVLTATLPSATAKPEHPVMRRGKPVQSPASTAATPEQYVTLVARVSIEDELRRMFFELTDADRFDITPRLTLVDAVDADGDGRGELLFREHTDQGLAWVLYRATADAMTKLYDSAE